MRTLNVFLAAGTLLIILTAPALAATPDNDTYANRTLIRELPFVDRLDTTEATTDDNDAEMNSRCGLPATDASVWYEFSPEQNGTINIVAAGSDYAVGLLLAIGSTGDFNLLACEQKAIENFAVLAGESYSLLVVDLDAEAPTGGLLVLSVELEASPPPPPPPPPPTIELTVERVARNVEPAGLALVSGTVTCSGSDVTVEAELQQWVAGAHVTGLGFAFVACDGSTQSWTAEVYALDGAFHVGPALAIVTAVGCDSSCASDSERLYILLRK